MEATTTANLLVNEFICRFGVPEYLHTDQGRNFEASLIKEMCRLLSIQKTRTTPYHPQSDGLIERFNRTLLSMLSIAAREDKHNWDLMLPVLLLAYRTSVHETTGETPSLLMLGREARLPVDIMYNLTPNKKDEPSLEMHNILKPSRRIFHKPMIEFAREWIESNVDRKQSMTKAATIGDTL
jgi:hypothetical protein